MHSIFVDGVIEVRLAVKALSLPTVYTVGVIEVTEGV
jgi:hypothetical protein